MEDSVSFLTGTHPETSFDMVMRGYHRGQVEEYVANSSQLLASLEAQLTTAQADGERARSAAAAADREAERLRSLAAEPRPAHEEVSGRLSQILGLATEEADQKRATADAEVAELRRQADEEVTRRLADASTEAKRVVEEARQTAERELTEARERIAALLDEAQRRAGAVDEVSARRLETLTETHSAAVHRLGEIRDVLAGVLQGDEAAGSLATVVDRVVAQGRREPAGPLPDASPDPDQATPAENTADVPEPAAAEVGLAVAEPRTAAGSDRHQRPRAAAGRPRRR